MGRGRAKAKQTKVARDLKYNTPNTDLSALQAELSGSQAIVPQSDDDAYVDGEEFLDDPYAKYYDDEDVTEDDSDETEQPSSN